MSTRLDQDRGNVADHVLGTVEGWDAFEVVRWHGTEELSRPFEFDITLRRAADKGPVDLDALLDTGATLRVATAQRWRTVHGILAEAEEIDRTRAFLYYRLLLVPPMWRMHHRKRCRTFVYRTIKDTLTCVLENRAHPGATPFAGLLPLSGAPIGDDTEPPFGSFDEPHGRFLWRVSDERRLTNKDLHPFVAQYNESDFDFLTRWLAHEGIAYYFQHTRDSVVLVLTDAPGQDALHETDREVTLRGGAVAGAHRDQELVRWLRDARRMRSRAVTMREYDYRRAGQVFDAQIAADGASSEAAGHFEFPSKDDRLADKLATFPAERRLQRFEAERRLRHGMSTVRTLSPGHALRLRDGDGVRDDEELVLVRSESFATQHSMEGSLLSDEPFGFRGGGQTVGAFENRFEVVPAKVPFRPATPPPREKIWGVQVARVWGPARSGASEEQTGSFGQMPGEGGTAEQKKGSDDLAEKVDIHCNEQGSIRIKLVWDKRNCEDGMPASDWCRVSQAWAGNAYGALFIPRVGQEVLVAYENGDPDRPVVVGCVYASPKVPPAYPPDNDRDLTRSTFTSRSTDGQVPAQGFNELRVTDYTGQEQIYLHAQKDLDEEILANHSTSVGGDQSNSVGHNQSNTVQGKRTHDVTGTESVHVHGDRTTHFDADEDHTVDGFLTTTIGQNEGHSVGHFRSTTVGNNDDLTVNGWRNTTVAIGENRTVTGPDAVTITADRKVTVTGNHVMKAGSNHTMDSTNMYITQAGEFQVNAATLWLNIGGCSLRMSGSNILLDNGAGSTIAMSGGVTTVTASVVLVTGTSAVQTVSGGGTAIIAGADINAAAANIHLNG